MFGSTVAEDQDHGNHGHDGDGYLERPEGWADAYVRLTAGNRERRRRSRVRLRNVPDGNCAHKWEWVGAAPGNWQLGDKCEHWECLRCEWCGGEVAKPCDSTSSSRCRPCGERYRKRVRTVAGSRFYGVPAGAIAMLTVTAPGERAHCRRHKDCEGIGPTCDQCPCTPVGGVDLAAWNPTATGRFDDMRTTMRNRSGDQLQTFRAAEVQERGAIHYHVLIGRDDGGALVLDLEELRALAIHHGFGHSVTLDVITQPERAAGYVAKYVSKAVDARKSLPWGTDASGRSRIGNGRYRCWTSTRRWGSTMREVIRAQVLYVAALHGVVEAEGGPAGQPRGAEAGPGGSLDPNSHHSESGPTIDVGGIG